MLQTSIQVRGSALTCDLTLHTPIPAPSCYSWVMDLVWYLDLEVIYGATHFGQFSSEIAYQES